MLRFLRTVGLLFGVGVGAINASMTSADEFTWDEFEGLHAELEPKLETWKTIPWHANLTSAQRAATVEKKLIFIWAMDGHPLGCT